MGGVAFYLAAHYDVDITGIEINPRMVDSANQQVPASLKNKLRFVHYQTLDKLPFMDNCFDMIYSKGVITHVQDKLALFKEFSRILNHHGELVIDDWLSPIDAEWGDTMMAFCELGNLSLFATSEVRYRDLLLASGFQVITMRDENKNYEQYNLSIVHQLKEKYAGKLTPVHQDAIMGYQLTADVIKQKQLLVRNIFARLIS